MSELWNSAYHEAGHVVVSWACGGVMDSARMHSGHCDMQYRLSGVSQEKASTIHALVSLAGQAAEVLFGEGPVLSVEHYSDFTAFGRHLQKSILRSASPDMAARVLTPIVVKLLTANDRAVHRVARQVVEHRHCWGDDLRATLGLQKKMFGVDHGPFGPEDWQSALLRAAEAEVVALEAEAKHRQRQSPISPPPQARLGPIEYKMSSDSGVLWIK